MHRTESAIPDDAHIIIIGAMKCGTSSLYEYLCAHPEICPCTVKEPEFFSENQGHGAQVRSYGDLFAYNNQLHRFTLEASTGYTKFPAEQHVPKRIYEYGISPKFIYIVRNPYRRIESHYNFMRSREGWNLSITDPHLISLSNYFLQLEQYRRYFPLSSIKILDFDDLKCRPNELLNQTYSFLGITSGHFPSHFSIRNPTRYTSAAEARVKQLRVGAILRILPYPVQNLLRSSVYKLLPQNRATLTESEKSLVFGELK